MIPSRLPMMAYRPVPFFGAMAISFWLCEITTIRIGDTIQATAVTSISTKYYHWYVDGNYFGSSSSWPKNLIQIDIGEQSQITVIGTNDASFDTDLHTPTCWPAKRTLWWVRSLDDCKRYAVEQKKDAGDWEQIANVMVADNKWSYEIVTGRLTDLSEYTWRVTPIDSAGNSGTVLTIGPETVVRTPDGPRFAIAFDPALVTFSEAV